MYVDEYEAILKGANGLAEDQDIQYIDLSDYIKAAKKKSLNSGSDRIAVIYAQGEILYGEGGPNYYWAGAYQRGTYQKRGKIKK